MSRAKLTSRDLDPQSHPTKSACKSAGTLRYVPYIKCSTLRSRATGSIEGSVGACYCCYHVYILPAKISLFDRSIRGGTQFPNEPPFIQQNSFTQFVPFVSKFCLGSTGLWNRVPCWSHVHSPPIANSHTDIKEIPDSYETPSVQKSHPIRLRSIVIFYHLRPILLSV